MQNRRGILILTDQGFKSIINRLHRGVAQLVARLVRVQEAVGSTPATPTSGVSFGILRFLFFANRMDCNANSGKLGKKLFDIASILHKISQRRD